MSLLTKGGISKLSELDIDADKDWQAKTISNLQGIAASMAGGDIAYRGVSVIERLAADYGVGTSFLRMKQVGADLLPEWADIQDLVAYITGGVNRVIALPTLSVVFIPTVATPVTAVQNPAKSTATPSLSLAMPTVGLATANPSLGAVSAVSHNDDVGDIDESTEANEDTANDMTLLPVGGAIDDYYALGGAALFDGILVKVSTAGAGITLAYEYSKGAGSWGTLTPEYNDISNWDAVADVRIRFARPGDWATDTLATLTRYWIRMRATGIVGFTQPLGQRAYLLTD